MNKCRANENQSTATDDCLTKKKPQAIDEMVYTLYSFWTFCTPSDYKPIISLELLSLHNKTLTLNVS